MFKSAATKFAHNSTIPALGGNQDLRPLQDLITAEKAVLISLQKLSVDYSKASEALRTWGLSEGDDLGDILSASTSILNHFSSALSQYAAHGHSMRDQLKAIRTREESWDDLKRRRRTVLRKADDAEKKLSKMSPEHKNLVMQTDTLNRLREEIRMMDSEIMTEEAALGDFKRTATRMWMGLKFGGLLECCEKGTIAGEYGKLTISEIPEESTQAGLPRSMYHGHNKVEGLVAEAHRCVNEVTLSTVSSVGFRDKRQYEQKSPNEPPSSFNSPNIGIAESTSGIWSGDANLKAPLSSTSQGDDSSFFQTPIRPFASNTSNLSLMTSLGNQPYAPPYQSQVSQGTASSSLSNTSQPLGVNEGAMDDFGIGIRSTGPADNSNTAAGRFATFPVKTRAPGSAGGYALHDPPSLSGRPVVGDSSFSASIAEALHEKEDTKAETLSPWSSRFNDRSELSLNSQGTTGAAENSCNPSTTHWEGRPDNDNPPPFEGLPPVSITAPFLQDKRSSGQSSSLPQPPPGAQLANPWASPVREGPLQVSGDSHRTSRLSENDDALLAYMTSADGDESPPHTAVPPTTNTTSSASTTNKEEEGRHVRFGSVEDVDKEMEKRVSLEKERQTRAIDTPSPLSEVQHANPDKDPGDSLETSETNKAENTSDTQKIKPASWRVPPPTIEDERALNAAAAREISLELSALKNNNNSSPFPPIPSQVEQRALPDPTPEIDQSRPTMVSGPRSNDYPGPPTALIAAGARDTPPMTAPSGARNLPPHPYAELNPPGVYSPYTQQPYQPPPISPAQAYAQSYQQQQQQPPSSSPYAPYSQPQAPDMRNNLPPRLQAMNVNNMPMDSQVPPRFQNPPSPIINSLPPRFQTNYTPPLGGVNMPDHHQQREDVMPPTAYPRPLASATSPLNFTKPSTSLPSTRNQPTPPLIGNNNTNTRTISAAAFKRPIPRNTGGSIDSDHSGMIGKKTLPSSPYPAVEMSGVHRKQVEVEDEYDYIGAYVNNSGPPSPASGTFRQHGQGTARMGGGGGGGGYGDELR